jgi:ParB family transcriptional regulator, chromosome partitioning protein
MAKGNRGFSELLTSGLDESAELEEQSPSKAIMASRSETLARIATGKVVADKTEFVDPARCRPWRLHNRDLDHLTEESCRDLIDAFLSAKKQRIPAIVRRVTDDPDYDYEIVAGVRRWWTVNWLRQHNHPEFDYLVTIQKIGDEEAFRVSDVENRSRKDITDWERAHEYLGAMHEFYKGSQAEMADHLNISRPWLSRLIDVARLPAEIVAAFSDRHDVTVRIARDLKPLAANPQSRKAMEACALEIIAERGGDQKKLTAAETAKRLVQATIKPAKGKAAREATREVSAKSGKPMLAYSVGANGTLTLKVLAKSGAGTEELLSAIEKLIGAR